MRRESTCLAAGRYHQDIVISQTLLTQCFYAVALRHPVLSRASTAGELIFHRQLVGRVIFTEPACRVMAITSPPGTLN